MAKITVFAPQGDSDSDGCPAVYEGHLTATQIKQVAAKIGGVGDGGYAGLELCLQEDEVGGGWMVTFARYEGWNRERYGKRGHRVDDEDQGDLYLLIYHSETDTL